jgi:Spy/CpxP family protein refolding chaperone
MHMFSERTQVLLSKQQLRALKQRARQERKSVGAVIRDAVDAFVEAPTMDERRAAMERLFAMNAPVDDWPVMKAQIEAGMLGQLWEEDDGTS